MRILMVEDHQDVAHWLCSELRHYRWTCDVAKSVKQAISMARHGCYGLILLDIMLPDGDGITLCHDLRTFTNVPILMVTAKDGLDGRVRALNDGADDYITKPFAVEELIARMRAILRRHNGDRGPTLEFGSLRVWPEERRAEQLGTPLALSRREFELLLVFMENANNVLSRDRILEKAWGYDFYGESNVVDVAVRRLRDHLNDNATIEIIAIRGVGYSLRMKDE